MPRINLHKSQLHPYFGKLAMEVFETASGITPSDLLFENIINIIVLLTEQE